jgi:hypothetical protein
MTLTHLSMEADTAWQDTWLTMSQMTIHSRRVAWRTSSCEQ